jgi:hypothetical protein
VANALDFIKTGLWLLTAPIAIAMVAAWLYTLISRKPHINRIRYGAFLAATFCIMAVGVETPLTLHGPLFAASLSLGVLGIVGFFVGVVRATLAAWAETIARSTPPR